MPPLRDGAALQGTTAGPDQLSLQPVSFGWHSWAITPAAAAALSRDAGMLRDHPQDTLVVTGHSSEEGSPEANFILSGKRASAVYEHLRKLGVPARRMRYRAEAEPGGRPSPFQRVVCFDVESGGGKAQ